MINTSSGPKVDNADNSRILYLDAKHCQGESLHRYF